MQFDLLVDPVEVDFPQFLLEFGLGLGYLMLFFSSLVLGLDEQYQLKYSKKIIHVHWVIVPSGMKTGKYLLE